MARAALVLAWLLVWGGSVSNALADYDGLLVSATPQSPVALGEPLEITVVVRNTGSYPWMGGDLPAWVLQIDSPSWPDAGWSRLNYVSWTDVNVDETVTVVATLDPVELPGSAGSYSVSLVAAYNAFDLDLFLMEGSPMTVQFTIGSANRPPVIDPIGEQTVVEGQLLSFQVTARDPDLPAQELVFSLDPGAPPGAAINSTNGLFTWTPPPDHSPPTNRITVRVTDTGSPPDSTTAEFNVVVLKPLRFEPMTRPTNDVVTLRWQTFPGKTYRLQYKENLLPGPWLNLGEDIIASGPLTEATNSMGNAGQRFYQVLLLD